MTIGEDLETAVQAFLKKKGPSKVKRWVVLVFWP